MYLINRQVTVTVSLPNGVVTVTADTLYKAYTLAKTNAEKKVENIKALRASQVGLGLKEAKDLIEFMERSEPWQIEDLLAFL